MHQQQKLREAQRTNTELNLEKLPPGIYFVLINAGDRRFSEEVIRE